MAGPDAAQSYVAMVRAWLERHKSYPDSARQAGEEGRVAVRLRVDRAGDVLGYTLVSGTGYPDLDGGVEGMLRGARMPPFPPELDGTEVELTVTLRFSLTR
jgi:periplasmic protein TonB